MRLALTRAHSTAGHLYHASARASRNGPAERAGGVASMRTDETLRAEATAWIEEHRYGFAESWRRCRDGGLLLLVAVMGGATHQTVLRAMFEHCEALLLEEPDGLAETTLAVSRCATAQKGAPQREAVALAAAMLPRDDGDLAHRVRALIAPADLDLRKLLRPAPFGRDLDGSPVRPANTPWDILTRCGPHVGRHEVSAAMRAAHAAVAPLVAPGALMEASVALDAVPANAPADVAGITADLLTMLACRIVDVMHPGTRGVVERQSDQAWDAASALCYRLVEPPVRAALPAAYIETFDRMAIPATGREHGPAGWSR